METFARAVGLGYRYLEIDVRLTADGVLVVFHDQTLDRVTDGRGRVEDLEWSDLQRARIGGLEPIPRFAEVLDAWPDVRFNIDPKCDRAVAPLAAEIRDLNAIDRVCVGSFSDRRIKALRAALGPRLCTSMGPAELLRLRLAAWGTPRVAVPEGAGCVQVPTRYGPVRLAESRSSRLLEFTHALGMQVHVWTINRASTMRRLLDLGVDGIMTDEIAILRDVLRERGQWHGA